MFKTRMLLMVSAAAFAVSAIGVGAQPANVSWSVVSKMPTVRNEVQAATVNGKIYIIGGAWTEMKDGKPVDHLTDGLNSEFDPATNQWRERSRAPEGLTHQGIAVLNGKIYLAGGFAGGRHTLPSAGVYSYDPATDRWTTLAPLSAPRGAVALIAVDGKIHAIGGRVMGDESTLATHEVYDPATNSWRTAAPLPTARDHVGIFLVGGKIHVIQGRTSDGTSNVALHDVYDPATDTWSTAAPAPTSRSSLAFAEYRGMLITAGGECTKDVKSFDDVEAYDTKTSRWITFPKLPKPLHGFAAAVANDKFYIFGGSVPCGGGGKVDDVLLMTSR